MSVLGSKSNGLVSGKTIVVTGCSSGIGATTANALREQGAKVIGVDLKPCSAVDDFFEADLSDPRAITKLVLALPQGLDGLCNIAGLPPTRPPADVLKVNLIGLKTLTYALVDKMADGAAITNLASLAGIGWLDNLDEVNAINAISNFDEVEAFCETFNVAGQPGRSYFLSKEALIVWTMQNRWTWRERGIRMNCISPGPVETPILPDFVETLGARVEEDMRVMDRPGTPGDVAPLVTFLQSDGSIWIRGANIPCDGGMSLHVAMEQHGLLAKK
ncbi:MAG: SDR family oxidoreductase [Alphaproteobacteria bacterium]|nr:SDR family oxidoreductase [Alphaproteobacteria bacterium]